MLSRILLALTVTAPLALMAQYVTTGPNGQLAPAGSTVIVVGSAGAPVLSTPSVTFGTSAGTAGISLADRAGISTTAPAATTVLSTPESYPVYSNPNVGAQSAVPETSATTGNGAVTTGRLINDAGPSHFAGAAFVNGSAAPGSNAAVGTTAASLGEIAAKYKSGRPQNIRTYTNADAQRLSDTMNMRGANANPASAQNTPSTTPQTQVANSTASATTTNTATPQLSATMRPSPAIRDESTQAGGTPQSSPTASTNEQGATTPQVGRHSATTQSQDNDQETGKRLPASSTLLPLFGILGLASGALGLFLRRYRR
jgi:hypothetical protein